MKSIKLSQIFVLSIILVGGYFSIDMLIDRKETVIQAGSVDENKLHLLTIENDLNPAHVNETSKSNNDVKITGKQKKGINLIKLESGAQTNIINHVESNNVNVFHHDDRIINDWVMIEMEDLNLNHASENDWVATKMEGIDLTHVSENDWVATKMEGIDVTEPGENDWVATKMEDIELTETSENDWVESEMNQLNDIGTSVNDWMLTEMEAPLTNQ